MQRRPTLLILSIVNAHDLVGEGYTVVVMSVELYTLADKIIAY